MSTGIFSSSLFSSNNNSNNMNGYSNINYNSSFNHNNSPTLFVSNDYHTSINNNSNNNAWLNTNTGNNANIYTNYSTHINYNTNLNTNHNINNNSINHNTSNSDITNPHHSLRRSRDEYEQVNANKISNSIINIGNKISPKKLQLSTDLSNNNQLINSASKRTKLDANLNLNSNTSDNDHSNNNSANNMNFNIFGDNNSNVFNINTFNASQNNKVIPHNPFTNNINQPIITNNNNNNNNTFYNNINSPNNDINELFTQLRMDDNSNSTEVRANTPNIHTKFRDNDTDYNINSNDNNTIIPSNIPSNDILFGDSITSFYQLLNLNVNSWLTFALAWKFDCKYGGCITRSEFINGMKKLNCKNISQLQFTINNIIQNEIIKNKSSFKSFYQFVFNYKRDTQNNNRKTIDIHSAIQLINILLLHRFAGHIQPLLLYLNTIANDKYNNSNTNKRINNDQWMSILEWCYVIEPFTLNGYDCDGCWPVLFDEYVEWYKKNYPNTISPTLRTGNNNSNNNSISNIVNKEINPISPNSPKHLIDAFNDITVNNITSPNSNNSNGSSSRQSSDSSAISNNNNNARVPPSSPVSEYSYSHAVYKSRIADNLSSLDITPSILSNSLLNRSQSLNCDILSKKIIDSNKCASVQPLDASDSDNEIRNNDNNNNNVNRSNNNNCNTYWPAPASPHSQRPIKNFNPTLYTHNINSPNHNNGNTNNNHDNNTFNNYSHNSNDIELSQNVEIYDANNINHYNNNNTIVNINNNNNISNSNNNGNNNNNLTHNRIIRSASNDMLD